jgi:hypothetical protein
MCPVHQFLFIEEDPKWQFTTSQSGNSGASFPKRKPTLPAAIHLTSTPPNPNDSPRSRPAGLQALSSSLILWQIFVAVGDMPLKTMLLWWRHKLQKIRINAVYRFLRFPRGANLEVHHPTKSVSHAGWSWALSYIMCKPPSAEARVFRAYLLPITCRGWITTHRMYAFF